MVSLFITSPKGMRKYSNVNKYEQLLSLENTLWVQCARLSCAPFSRTAFATVRPKKFFKSICKEQKSCQCRFDAVILNGFERLRFYSSESDTSKCKILLDTVEICWIEKLSTVTVGVAR